MTQNSAHLRESRHTWLFEPGTWSAGGRFWEKGEIAHDARGTSIIRHRSDGWTIAGTMEIFSAPPLRFENEYRLDPPSAGARIVPWHSVNPTVGTLTGVFVVAGDTIMSSFRSADGAALGGEHLTLLAPDRYQARGLFLVSGKVVSAWSVTLVRQV